jgi:hypothetical protein
MMETPPVLVAVSMPRIYMKVPYRKRESVSKIKNMGFDDAHSSGVLEYSQRDLRNWNS